MAGRRPNVGRRDRIMRAIVTPFAIAGALWLYNSVPPEPLNLVAIGLLSAVAFVCGTGAITGTCGVYAVVGIDTCSCEVEYSGGDTWG